MTKDELVEKVAKAMAQASGDYEDGVLQWQAWLPDANIALAIAMPAAFEMAAEVAQKLTVCTEWWEGLERSVRHPSPAETATAIRAEGEKWYYDACGDLVAQDWNYDCCGCNPKIV